MRRELTTIFVAALAAFAAADARAQAGPRQPAPAEGAQQQQQARPQSAEAAEVERLGRTVAELYRAGRLKEALPVAERAVALVEAASPQDARATATAYANLGAVLAGMGKFGRARAAYERALPLLEREAGADDAATNRVREYLASALYRDGENARAEQLLTLALASGERTLGADHDSVKGALASLAFFYLATGQAEKRDAAYARLLDAAEKSPDNLPEEVKKVLARYATEVALRSDAGAEAKAIYQRIQALWSPVSGGVLNGRAVSKPAPEYPPEAKAARAQGTVVLQITVDEEGRVIEAKPLSGHRLLQSTSARAAMRARFEPTVVEGKPVKITGTITYNFVIQ